MTLVASLLLLLCSSWIALGVAATLRVRLGREASSFDEPANEVALGVSVMKPLAGADPGLEKNLESFFLQDHQRFELIFGVVDADDPALTVVKRLCARYPGVATTVVVHDGGRGLNPKVANLLGMLPHAHHDAMLISDSNVRAPAHYVREMSFILARDERPGLVTNLFVGAGEDTLGSALESVQLAGFCAGGTALPTLLGDALVVGKSMMMSQRSLEALGGLGRVADVLAEDWMLGKMFEHAGLPVRLAPTILENVSSGTSIIGFLERQLRWAMIRSRLRPLAQFLEIATSPVALLPLAMLVWGPTMGVSWSLAMLTLRDAGGWLVLRGPKRVWIPLLLSPLREASMFYVWLRAPFKRHITWRGHRVRVGMGTFGFKARRT